MKNLIKQLLREGLENASSKLTFDTLPECVKNNFLKNITVSVAFVKADGKTVRHMAFRRNLLSYEKSQAEKTQAQANYLTNNNLMNVYDTNLFIKSKKAYMDAGMTPEEAAKKASKESYRNVKLENVLGFLCGGKFYDMREKNDIAARFDAGVYDQLTKGMVMKMKADEDQTTNELK